MILISLNVKRLILLLTLFGIFNAISDIHAASNCKLNNLGIKVCKPPNDQEICMVVSVWRSNFYHPKNRSYTTLLKCEGVCKSDDKKFGINKTFSDCKNSLANEKNQNVYCIKVGCGASTLQ